MFLTRLLTVLVPASSPFLWQTRTWSPNHRSFLVYHLSLICIIRAAFWEGLPLNVARSEPWAPSHLRVLLTILQGWLLPYCCYELLWFVVRQRGVPAWAWVNGWRSICISWIFRSSTQTFSIRRLLWLRWWEPNKLYRKFSPHADLSRVGFSGLSKNPSLVVH